MSDYDPGEAPERARARNDIPGPVPPTPASAARSRKGMGCGMGSGSMSTMLAVLVGVALGGLLFGGGVTSLSQIGGWTFLLFLLPCLVMAGAMMTMMSGGTHKQNRP